jgi:cytochrome c-type protein NapB
MRGLPPSRNGLRRAGLGPLLRLLLAAACGRDDSARVAVPGHAGATKTPATMRALRRAYDGAPPVVPHQDFRMACTSCHKPEGVSLPEIGFAPPMPHEQTRGLSAISNCKQCHVFKRTDETFRASSFEGLRQDLRPGRQMHLYAPPVLPHPVFMRENCLACHTGPAAREEVRCDHPERPRCVQCHVPRTTAAEFSREP